MRTVKGSWSLVVLGSIVFSSLLSACGGSSDSGSQNSSTSAAPPATGSAASPASGSSASVTPPSTLDPKIQGIAPTTATAGQPYSFQPQASGGTAPLSFTIANKPVWASFDAATGKLSGTPSASEVGLYSNIEIAATDGTAVTSLAAFNISVGPAGASSQSTTLSWVPPTANTDGSTLSDLKGFKIHYGSASQSYTETIDLDNAGLTTYVVQNLSAGKYYFTVTAYNSAGIESPLSAEVSTQVD
jgi:hypothetical protein